MATHFVYLFEAKSIQAYILDTGRLADLIGASDLVADLCSSEGNDLLAEVLAQADASDLEFSRRAGGAFCVHGGNPDQLKRIRALWRLAVSARVPGLAFVDTLVADTGSEIQALQAAYASQPGLRENSSAALLPFGGPMTAFSARSGRAVTETRKAGTDRIELDRVNAIQHTHGKELARRSETDRLVRVFLPEDCEEATKYLFPRHFERGEAGTNNPAFPFGGVDARIAVIHADISGLGQVFRQVTEHARRPGDVHGVATAIEAAISRAARKASGDHLLPHAARKGDRDFENLFGRGRVPQDKQVVPARPVLLGGDDITIITRADLAIGFTKALLQNIEDETKEEFSKLREMGHNAPVAGLTAGAGIAIVRAGHPFLAAHNMAEGLCRTAKKKAKKNGPPYPSILDFAVITSTIDEDFKRDYRPREQTTETGQKLYGGPYLLQTTGTSAGLDTLLELAQALSQAPGHGKLLSALGLFHSDPTKAEAAWSRYRQVLADEPDLHEAVRSTLEKMPGVSLDANPPKLCAAFAFLNDALELVDIGAVGETK